MDFRISVEEKGEVTRDINIEIPRDVYNQRFDRILSQTVARTRIKGFRPGHAPKAMVAKLYGEQIRSDVLNDLVSSAYREAVTNHSLKVVGSPAISVDSEKPEEDLKITAAVEIYPEPQISNYKDLSFEVPVEQFREEQIDERIQGMREQQSRTEDVTDREEVQPKDLVRIDYEGTVDGVAFPGSSGQDVVVELGAQSAPSEIETALLGAKVGETRTADLTLPEDSGEELAGKTAQYSLTVKALQRKVLPELDDEFAKGTHLAEDMQGLRDAVRTQLQDEVTRKNESEREEKLFRKLVELNPFEVPQALVDHEIRTILMEMRFLDPRKEESYQMDVARFRGGLGESAEFRVRREIILQRIIESEGVSASDDEVGAWLDQEAARHSRTREDIDKVYGFPKNLERLKEIVSRQKMVEKLLETATITEVEPAAPTEE